MDVEEVEVMEAPEIIEEEEPLEVEEEIEEEAEDEEHDEVTLGDEVINAPDPEEQKAPRWVKDLRKQHKEAQRKIKELESQLTQPKQAVDQPKPRAKKPTLEDYEWDADKFQEGLESWFKDEQKHEIEAIKAQEAQKEAERAWQTKNEDYNKKKASLKVSDFEDAEHAVMQSLSATQQGIILQGADNPALLAYAIGKNPKRLAELAKMTDHVQFAFQVAKLEKDLKVVNRKPTAAPEKSITGTGRAVLKADSTLDKLRARAEKTGNYSEVIAYKRSKNNN